MRDTDGSRDLEERLQAMAGGGASPPPTAALLAAAVAAAAPPACPEREKLALGRVYNMSKTSLAAECCSKLAVGFHNQENVKFGRQDFPEK